MQENDAGLSEREQQILRLAATGASNKEIADRLGISANTVKVHLRHIFEKTGAGSRTASVLYAVQHGLLEGPPNIPPETEKTPAAPAARQLLRRWLAWLLAALAVLLFGLLASAPWDWPPNTPDPTRPSQTAIPRRWSSLPALPQPRSAMAAAAAQGDLYLIGGKTPSGVTASTLRFSSAQGLWQKRAAKPLAVVSASAALLGERLYIPGGILASGQVVDALEVYDLRRDRWSRAAPLPEPLAEYGLAAFEGRLYLFGGRANGAVSDRVYVYDPMADAWSQGGRLPSPRFGAAAAALESSILVAGGSSGATPLAETLAYYPARRSKGEDAWEVLPSLPAGGAGAGAASLADSVYLAGGSDAAGNPLPLLRYTAGEPAWVSLEPPPQPLASGFALLASGSTLHLVGGEQEGRPLARHQAYQAFYTILIPLIP